MIMPQNPPWHCARLEIRTDHSRALKKAIPQTQVQLEENDINTLECRPDVARACFLHLASPATPTGVKPSRHILQQPAA